MRIPSVVFSRQFDPRSLPDPHACVLGVLEVTQLGRRGELEMVPIGDTGRRQSRLQTDGVRPRIFPAANATTLAHIDEDANVSRAQRLQEPVEPPPVDTDRDQTLH